MLLIATTEKDISSAVRGQCLWDAADQLRANFDFKSHGGKLGDISIYGQESNATTRRLAVMNLALRGIEISLWDCMVALPGQLFYSTPFWKN